ncbi:MULTISPECIES: helix-turn-helix domain-containing protein [Stenotrophomonas]|jgi:transcriptional regulator with XRE-family HTH domain|uniref:helix-turn-helix domain-containing protein n=1 Tax=Stenotrophomonas TaxID=40323 RepID=UPI00066BE0C9|nr:MULTISPECIES: helix-turn-helix transcriptional regulator [Stenotrophomonas]MBO8043393.1 helix-turn-helix transcriptional regulator [Pseudomonas aeruginosa]MBA0338502.1 XRE family transcriptional regulator [Stenotrophomonas maltophilia]MBA0542593.1 XRE family transcriptional regulator [Stenotrophomonas maltophilia]MBH1524867.1 helix-turn-helix transcriptional regulator [Stenotrophomonas maltophilia]MBH1574477.1 helix-turn-helix transcriptional regulator [Stenotrophomonas maltophilia]
MEEDTVITALAHVIRSRRVALGYSQDSFADHIGMHRSYYAALERGRRNMTLATLERVGRGLNSTLAQLFADAGI